MEVSRRYLPIENTVQFVRVKDRKAETLLQVIQIYVKEGSIIWTDQWQGYNILSEHGSTHSTINHSLNYVDPITQVHTQSFE